MASSREGQQSIVKKQGEMERCKSLPVRKLKKQLKKIAFHFLLSLLLLIHSLICCHCLYSILRRDFHTFNEFHKSNVNVINLDFIESLDAFRLPCILYLKKKL